MMNDVYQAVRAVTAHDRLAKVTQEQLAWLTTRDAVQSVEEKPKLTESRIRTLQELLWSFNPTRCLSGAFLAPTACVSIPEFSFSAQQVSLIFCAVLFHALRLQPCAVPLERFRSHRASVPAQAFGSPLASANPEP